MMNNPAMSQPSTQALRLTPIRLRFRSLDLTLKTFAGPLWRSGFGLALERNFPGVFQLLYAPQGRLGRLYALTPPAAPILPGKTFVLGLNLFGPATDHALASVQALSALGEIGLGEPRGHFTLEQAWVVGAEAPFLDRTAGLTGAPAPIPLSHWLERTTPAHRAQVELLTPLQMKYREKVVLEAPRFSVLVAGIHNRIKELCKSANEDNPLPWELRKSQLTAADKVELEFQELRQVRGKHRSARTGETMRYEGITGTLIYRGDLPPCCGLLRLAEIIQVGGKTAYGLGCYRGVFE